MKHNQLREPCLIREVATDHWMAWNQYGERVIAVRANFELLSQRLFDLGFEIISPNSALAGDILEQLRSRHNL